MQPFQMLPCECISFFIQLLPLTSRILVGIVFQSVIADEVDVHEEVLHRQVLVGVDLGHDSGQVHRLPDDLQVVRHLRGEGAQLADSNKLGSLAQGFLAPTSFHTSSMSTGLLKMLKRLSVANRLVTSLRKSRSSRSVFSSCSARRRCSSADRTLGPGASATGRSSLHLPARRVRPTSSKDEQVEVQWITLAFKKNQHKGRKKKDPG